MAPSEKATRVSIILPENVQSGSLLSLSIPGEENRVVVRLPEGRKPGDKVLISQNSVGEWLVEESPASTSPISQSARLTETLRTKCPVLHAEVHRISAELCSLRHQLSASERAQSFSQEHLLSHTSEQDMRSSIRELSESEAAATSLLAKCSEEELQWLDGTLRTREADAVWLRERLKVSEEEVQELRTKLQSISRSRTGTTSARAGAGTTDAKSLPEDATAEELGEWALNRVLTGLKSCSNLLPADPRQDYHHVLPSATRSSSGSNAPPTSMVASPPPPRVAGVRPQLASTLVSPPSPDVVVAFATEPAGIAMPPVRRDLPQSPPCSHRGDYGALVDSDSCDQSSTCQRVPHSLCIIQNYQVTTASQRSHETLVSPPHAHASSPRRCVVSATATPDVTRGQASPLRTPSRCGLGTPPAPPSGTFSPVVRARALRALASPGTEPQSGGKQCGHSSKQLQV